LKSLRTALPANKSIVQDEISAISRQKAADVDPWVSQAKRIHEEIAKSRAIARDIVRGHEASKALAAAAEDAGAKLNLLDEEITYSTQIAKALEDLRLLDNDLQSLHVKLSKSDTLAAAKKWTTAQTRLETLQDHNGKRIMLDRARQAHRACLMQAEVSLDRMFNVGQDGHEGWIHITQELDGKF
jgi:hypothetical protein